MIDPSYAQRVLDLLDQGVPVELVIREEKNRSLTIEVKDSALALICKAVRDDCVDALTFKPDFSI